MVADQKWDPAIIIGVRAGQASGAVLVGRRSTDQRLLGLGHRGGRRLFELVACAYGVAPPQDTGGGGEKGEEHEAEQCGASMASAESREMTSLR